MYTPSRPHVIEISDFSSPELDVFARLTDAQLRNRLEREKGIAIAESLSVIRLALEAGCEALAFLMERKHIDGQAKALLARYGDVPVYTADSDLLAGLAGYHLSRGILCALRRPPLPDAESLCADAQQIAVLENITDATNVGAIFRSAAGLGIDLVLVTPSCCDPLGRRAMRVSMGTVFQVPWTYICRSPADWPQPSLARLHAMGFKTLAMVTDAAAVSLDELQLKDGEKLAIVFGTEGDGLAPGTTNGCDCLVRIPMSHKVDSLNVAAASAVAFWQLRRGN